MLSDLSATLEHFPEKWTPVFRRKCDQLMKLERFQINVIGKALN